MLLENRNLKEALQHWKDVAATYSVEIERLKGKLTVYKKMADDRELLMVANDELKAERLEFRKRVRETVEDLHARKQQADGD